MPCLLLRDGALVKTIAFRDPSYVGDPVNAIRIYNEKEVDELIFLDIGATSQGRRPRIGVLERIAGESFMPAAYGGGLRSLDAIRTVLKLGFEKVSINTDTVQDPSFVSQASQEFGSQSIIVSIDARGARFGRYEVLTHGGTMRTSLDPAAFAAQMQAAGAGEILLTSIDRDGTQQGYDIDLIRQVVARISVPVIACGGAGKIEDIAAAVKGGGRRGLRHRQHGCLLWPQPGGADLVPTQSGNRASVWRRRVSGSMRRCSRCLYDETVPGITFDAQGVCGYCHMHDRLDREYPTGRERARKLKELAEGICKRGRGRKYDVIVGVSGGCDSSYMLYQAVKLGLRPLAAHFDNTWDSTVAVENIQAVLRKLDVDLHTYVVDNNEYDDMYRSFLKAGVLDIETPTDIGLAAVLYMVAEKYRVKHIFEGHSFRTEGMAPLGWVYMDGKYVQSVQRRFGTVPPFARIPTCCSPTSSGGPPSGEYRGSALSTTSTTSSRTP